MECKTNDNGQDDVIKALYCISANFDIDAPKDLKNHSRNGDGKYRLKGMKRAG